MASRAAIEARAEGLAQRLVVLRPRRVVNATGVVLHTNLGRAPLGSAAAAAVADAAAGYSDLELDLETGRRGNRLGALCDKLALLCGSEAAYACITICPSSAGVAPDWPPTFESESDGMSSSKDSPPSAVMSPATRPSANVKRLTRMRTGSPSAGAASPPPPLDAGPLPAFRMLPSGVSTFERALASISK